MIGHILELGVVGTTSWLAYVTQFPYHVRRRQAQRAKDHLYRLYILCRHHGHWILWQVTVIVPRKKGSGE